MVDAGEGALVHPQLEVLRHLAEDRHGVRHRLEAHRPPPGEVRRRGDVLVGDGRAHHDPVVARPEPALAFRQVHLQAALEHVRLAAVGLHPGEEPVLVRPADVGRQEALLEELDHRAVEVVAGAAHGVGAGSVVARVVAVEDEGQVRREVVAAPPRELGGQVVRPVRVVELEAVHEARAQRAAQLLAEPPAEGGGEAGGHVVEVAADRRGAPVVHHRTVRARRSELDVREARLEEPHVEDVRARRDAHADASAPQRARGELRARDEVGPARAHEAEEGELRRDLDLLALLLPGGGELGERGLERRRAGELLLHEADALRLLRRLQEAPAEGPARADDDVGGHAARARALGRRLHRRAPLRAQPRPLGEGGEAVLRHVVPHRDRVDLEPADAGGLHHVELAEDLGLGDPRAVPPPAHEGAKTLGRAGEGVEQRVGGRRRPAPRGHAQEAEERECDQPATAGTRSRVEPVSHGGKPILSLPRPCHPHPEAGTCSPRRWRTSKVRWRAAREPSPCAAS